MIGRSDTRRQRWTEKLVGTVKRSQQLAQISPHMVVKIVRGADTARPELAPQAAGLLAISLGLSANFADDHTMLEQGMVVYDALYTWCRSLQQGTHNWTPGPATT